MMHMSFWFGDNLGDFFFNGLEINSPSSMVLLCVILFMLSISYEGLKVHRAYTRAKIARQKRSPSCAPSENATLLSNGTDSQAQKPLLKNIIEGLKELLTFLLHNVLNYGLMLAVMMYNGYIFIAVTLGMFVGYFLFGNLSMKINMENLQAIQTKFICSARCAQSEEPCTSGTTPVVSHCPAVSGEPSESSALSAMQNYNSESSSSSGTETIVAQVHQCH